MQRTRGEAGARTGGDAGKRMSWNLLMGQHARRTGYAWLELGRVAEDGRPHYFTLGAGLHAVEGRPQVEAWYFIAVSSCTVRHLARSWDRPRGAQKRDPRRPTARDGVAFDFLAPLMAIPRAFLPVAPNVGACLDMRLPDNSY